MATIYLGQRSLAASSNLPGSQLRRTASSSLFGFAPDGVYLADRVTSTAGALLPHRFTLATHRDSPTSEDACGPQSFGGLLSVALSLTSRPVGVTNHPVLRCPDFPPQRSLRSAATAIAPPTRSCVAA